MKRLMCVILIALFMTGCAADSSAKQSPPTVSPTTAPGPFGTTAAPMPTTVPVATSPNSRVRITQKNGQWLMRFNEGHDVLEPYISMLVCFDSIAQMRERIYAGDFDMLEERLIKNTAPRNEDGDILICNLDELYEATAPEGFEVKEVVWRFTHYSIELANGEDHYRVRIHTQEDYEESLQRDYYDIPERWEKISMEQDPEHGGIVIMYEYNGTLYKEYRYEQEVGGKVRYFVERYYFPNEKQSEHCGYIENGMATSIIFMFGNEFGQPFSVNSINGQKKWLTTDQLIQFGITPFEGNEPPPEPIG